MEKDKIIYPYLLDFMRKTRRERDGFLGEMEREARKEEYPISEPETADLIDIICRIKKPRRILEIGTCIGFSALLMKEACGGKAIIHTLERNPAMIKPARENFEKYDPEKTITMFEGSALETLEKLTEPYDFIFLDAAKGQYPYFLEHIKRLLSPDGILISDNVFFGGYVAKGEPDVRRNRTIVTRLGEYLEKLENISDMHTVLLPISDGVTLSYRMVDEN